MSDQLQMFDLGSTLMDATLDQRAAAAVAVIADGDVPLAERELLLLLAVAPAAFGEADR